MGVLVGVFSNIRTRERFLGKGFDLKPLRLCVSFFLCVEIVLDSETDTISTQRKKETQRRRGFIAYNL